MRELTALDYIMVALIAAIAALNAALYGGVLHTPDPAAAELSADREAELDDDPDLPGRYVPPQHRQHTGDYPLAERVEFCVDRVHSDCYSSNPPTSGLHIGVMRDVRLEDGHVIDLPPPPGVYDFEIPRESIPHIEEHAGVYVGYRCTSEACREAVGRAERLVQQELRMGARVVMSPDGDLAEDTIALASWTRIDSFAAADYGDDRGDDRVRDFIDAHSCRFDPEGFCRARGQSVLAGGLALE